MMTTFLFVNIIITLLLFAIFAINYHRGLDSNSPAPIALALILCQIFICYTLIGLAMPCGNTRINTLPAANYEIVKSSNSVFLIYENNLLKEFKDAKTYNIKEYKNVIKTITTNAYNFDSEITYSLE